MTDAHWGQVIVASVAVAGSVLGYVLAGFNDARRDRRAAAQQRRARAEDRHDKALETQRSFQLETLLALQDAVQSMGRLNYKAMHFDHMQAREGKFVQLPSELNEQIHANDVEVHRLSNRLLDDDLRESISRFSAEARQASTLPEYLRGLDGEDLEAAATQAQRSFFASSDAVMSKLGTALRQELGRLPVSPG